ncbi:hypothetical protein GDO81_027211 [Engystomops pustulosus]|uniref:Uncharacterized protein n=1 Tax=Engystomops pustulosus TaxID=76066 RepID=A0AAV6YL83_ENGPU|nr:hypothetical protein GDO81_027211 [Engystomops pustulosus]
MPITEQASPVSSSPSPPFGDSATVSPSFMPRATPQPLTFTTATFAATKFGSTKMKTNARNKLARSSPTQFGFNVNNLLKQSAMSSSVHSVYSLGLSNLPQKTSALSPNAKEFIFPGVPDPGRSGDLGPLPYSSAFDVFAAYGGLNDKSLVEGLSLSLSNVQYSNQQFQPVMAN